MKCWSCQKSEDLPEKPSRLDTCPHCNSFLHCCLQCKFYDKSSHNECREPQAEWVQDKKMANFCGYFMPRDDEAKDTSPPKKLLTKEEAEKKWAILFKKR